MRLDENKRINSIVILSAGNNYRFESGQVSDK